MAQEEQVEVSGPGGLGFKFKGQNPLLLTVLLMCALAGGLWWVLNGHAAESKNNAAENAAAMKALTAEVKGQSDTLKAVIYVLTLPEKERAKLDLQKPEKLKEMQR